jgi:hypothetical protein
MPTSFQAESSATIMGYGDPFLHSQEDFASGAVVKKYGHNPSHIYRGMKWNIWDERQDVVKQLLALLEKYQRQGRSVPANQ